VTDQHHESEEAAVGEVLMRLGQAFARGDTAGIGELYAEDADWTNAFGTSRHGRDAIVDYLEKLFADKRFAAGRLRGRPEGSIRFLGHAVAVAKTYAEREGQETVEGGTLPVRRNHSLKVLEKRDGHWRIVSEMYMDARDEETLVRD